MSGRICLITGGTAGIGAATARELARRGARVVIVGRTAERCQAAAETIRRNTGAASVEFIAADLSSQREVRRCAAEFLRRHDRLDVLINNAGALYALRRESVDGIEMTLALNHLAPFLLTNLLLDALKATAPSRIINISSSAHDDVKALDFDDLQARHRKPAYSTSEFASLVSTLTTPWAHPGFVQYAQTKLASLLLTYEFARRLAGTGITVNAVHPGFVSTGFTAGNGALGRFMRIWFRLLGITPEEGAKTVVYAAASPEVGATTGAYFVKQKAEPSSKPSRDATSAARVWSLSEQLIAPPGA